MRALAVVCLVLLAGCTSDDVVDGGSEAVPSAHSATIDAPAWAIGDWWTYSFGGAGITWVVTGEAGSDWLLAVDDPGMMFSHEAFEQTSTIGEVSKAHLAGSQEAGRVEFFQFPLTLNKTWSLTWDGIAFDATVVDIADGRATIEALAADGSMREYVYDNATRWFDEISAVDANGTLQFETQLDRSGDAYPGTYAKWTLYDEYVDDSGFGEASLNQFTVPDEATDVWGWYRITCSPDGLEGEGGSGLLEVHPEGDSNAGISEHITCPVDIEETVEMDPHPGQWGVTVQSSGARIESRFIPRTLELLGV